MPDIKTHFGVPFISGFKAICGRTRTKQKVTTREKWNALPETHRCDDCNEAVKRNGAPRRDRIGPAPSDPSKIRKPSAQATGT